MIFKNLLNKFLLNKSRLNKLLLKFARYFELEYVLAYANNFNLFSIPLLR